MSEEKTERGAPILEQCPKRRVGDSVYVSVPGRVPVIRPARAVSPTVDGGTRT